MHVPDNYNCYVVAESDRARIERLHSRFENELGIERFNDNHINHNVDENMEDIEDERITNNS